MELIAIGKILKPFGINGAVKVFSFSPDNDRFSNLQNVWIGADEKSVTMFKVSSSNITNKQIVISFDRINSITTAEKYKDQLLFICKEDRVILSDNNYFVDDIIGCLVVSETNEEIGIVADILSAPQNDLWLIKNKEEEHLIPAVKAIIKNVDLKNKRITINTLEGLID